MNPSTKRVPVPTLLVRGLLVAVLPLLIGTCRIGDLLRASEGALLCIDPPALGDTLRDSAPKGSLALRATLIGIKNCGGSELQWNANIQAGSPWADIVPASGTVDIGPPVNVMFNPAGLDTGIYHDNAVVNSPASSAAQEVPIWFRVYPCRPQPMVIDDSVSATLTSAECGAPHRPGRFAKIYSFPGTANDFVTIEVPAGYDAYVALDSSLVSSVAPLAETDDCLGATGDPCLYYQRLPRNQTYFVEVTSADSADSGAFKMRLVHPRIPNVPDSIDQRLADSTTSVAIGATVNQTSILLRAVLSDPDLGDSLHLEAEVRPIGTAFSGPNIPNGPKVANGRPAWVNATGLIDNTSYHWRVRAGDNTGRVGPWDSLPGGTDFIINVPHPPDLPATMAQAKPDLTPISQGATTDTNVVLLSATISDQDQGDQIRLLVEVQPVGINFINSPTDSSAAISGGTATVTFTGTNGTSYHWQARAKDQTGATSNWVSFGNNSDPNGVDFRIQVAQIPNAPAGLVQLQSNGTDIIAVGGDASQTNVVFSGQVSDPDVGQTVRLDVEYKPVNTNFTDIPTVSSTFVPNGSQASVGSLTLTANTSYHWQARAVDNTGKLGGWVSYPLNPPNAESATDFHVATPVAQLIFSQQPTSATAGVAIAPAIRVTAADASGIPVTSFTGAITLAIAANPGGGTLSGTTSQNAVAGVATFNDVSINKAGINYTLLASTSGFNRTSNQFTISAAATSQLAFTGQPSTQTAGVAIAPPILVSGQDAFGNFTSGFSGTVTLTIAANPGGGVLGGTTAQVASGGVATFNNISINKSGVGYTLRAGSASLTPDTSLAFNINPGPATRVQFTGQPTNTPAGNPITPPVAVSAFDANSNLATGFSGPITVAILNNPPPGGTLAGTTTVNANSGVASFNNLSINQSGSNYTLQATSGSLTPDTSGAFDILTGAPTLVFTTQPGQSMAGAAINEPGPGVVVTARDGLGNTVTSFTGLVTITIGTNPGAGTLGGTTSVTANAGVATFTTLNINKIGNGYTLIAQAPGAGTGTSAGFNIIPNNPAVLLFVQQPSNAAANATITPAITVQAQDLFGNNTPLFTSNVNMTIAANPGTGTLGGTTSVAAINGVATFSTLTINKSGAGYTLRAGSPGLTPDTSAAFTITGGPATHLVFSVQPSTDTANRPIQPAVQVTALDAGDNIATGFTGNVSMAINTGPVGGTLTGTLTVPASGGVATFSNLVLHKIGAYTLQASAALAQPTVNSISFNVIPGPAHHLQFTVNPVTTAAGVSITPAVQVTAQDFDNNTATTFTSNITVAILANPGLGILSGTKVVAATAGVSNFGNLSINKTGVGYTLIATATGIVNDISNTFDIVPGPAAQLVFTTQPSNTQAAATIAPPVQVTVQDNQGNTVTGYSGNVVVQITPGTGTAGAALGGTLTKTVVNGIATFSDLSIDLAGNGYTLRAASAGVPGGPFDSNPFAITGGMATQLFFTTQPTNSTAGIPVNPSVVVTARDAQGNTASFTGNVTISVFSGPPGAALTPSSTPTVAAVGGVATFNNLRLNKTGGGYVLHAAAGALSTNSAGGGFTVNPGGASASLSTVGASPPSITASSSGSPIQSTVTVTARDTLGNLIPSANVVFSASGGGNTMTPSGTTNGSGVATGTLSSTVAEGKTVSVTINGVAITQTAPVTVTAATVSASTSTLTRLPTTIQASSGSIMSTMTATARDQFSNVISGATVVFGATGSGNTLTPNPPAGSTTGVNGVATGTLSSTVAELKVGSATIDGVTITPTVNITVTPASATTLLFTLQPTNTAAGATIRPATGVQVEVRDQFNNRVTSAANNVTMSILNNAGPGGILAGTNPVSAAPSGIAVFSNLSIDKTGNGYTLLAVATGLTPDTSAAFNITPGGATKLAFFTQPSNTTGGTPFGTAVQVEIQDASGNRVTSATNSITLAIGTNPNNGSLSGTVTQSAVAGLATFPGLSIDSAGTGYTLGATSSPVLTPATSNSFNVTVGAATKLGFVQQPTQTAGGATITPAVTVAIQDAGGNRVNSSASVTVAFGTNPGGLGTLSGTKTVAASAGLATFNTLSIDHAASGYTLAATSGALTGATSNAFTIVAGSASKLGFVQQPTQTAGGATITPAVTVEILDAGNNRVNSSANVTVALGTNPGGLGTLSGTKTVAASAGLATFSTLNIDHAASGYTLSATSGSLTGATSNAFNIIVGSAAQLGFVQQPTQTAGGATITPAVTVEILDAGNNRVNSSANVTVAFGTNPGGLGTLSGTKTVAASAGLATFSTLGIDHAATGYTLNATSGSLTGATSDPFNIVVGAAAKLAFQQQPTSATAGVAIAPQITVRILDAGNNLVSSATNTVVIAILNNAGGGTLSGDNSNPAAGGVASFNTLSIDKAGTAYTLQATSGSLTAANSSGFNITHAGADHLVFTVQPSNTSQNQPISPAVKVEIRDAFENLVTDATDNVTIDIGNNPGIPSAGTLAGTTTVGAVAGVATFNDLSIDNLGIGYTLVVTSGSLTGATSDPFDITL